MEIDIKDVKPVTTHTGQILRNEKGEICVEHITDGELYFLQPTEEVLKALKIAKSAGAPERPFQQDAISKRWTPLEESGPTTSSANEEKRTKWSHVSIAALISTRIAMDKQFQSTTEKTEVTWKRLAEEMRTKGFLHTSTQCNDKWRYLKAKYMRKKDNMGSRGTGEPPMEFEFFEILDEFLGKKHNVVPTAIASSMQGDTMPSTDNSCVIDDEPDSETSQPSKKRRIISKISNPVQKKKTPVETLLEKMTTSSKERDDNRERRHQEMLQMRNKAIDVFSTKMDDLMNVMKQK